MLERMRGAVYDVAFTALKNILPHPWLEHTPKSGTPPDYVYRATMATYVWLLRRTARETRAVLDLLTERRLDKLLRAAGAAEYWQDILKPLLRRPVSRATLSAIPVTARQILKDVPQRSQQTADTAHGQRLMWRRTSGTTGVPFSWGCDARTFYMDFPAFYFRMFAYYGHPWSAFSGRNICILNFHDTSRHPLYPFVQDLQWTPQAPDSDAKLDRVLAQLASTSKPVLHTYPTDLWLLTEELKKRNLRPSLAFIITAGQMLEDEVRMSAEEYFGCPVRSFYTSREISAIAMECREHSGLFHVHEEQVIVEVLDADGRAAAPGTWGDIAVTSLGNLAMPLLRYRIGDKGREVPGVCSCGTSLQCIELQGRYTEFITHGGATIAVHQICSAIIRHLFSRIRQYQIQEEETGIRILLVPKQRPLTEEDYDALRKTIVARIGHPLPISFSRTDSIPRSGGKFERFVPFQRS